MVTLRSFASGLGNVLKMLKIFDVRTSFPPPVIRLHVTSTASHIGLAITIFSSVTLVVKDYKTIKSNLVKILHIFFRTLNSEHTQTLYIEHKKYIF